MRGRHEREKRNQTREKIETRNRKVAARTRGKFKRKTGQRNVVCPFFLHFSILSSLLCCLHLLMHFFISFPVQTRLSFSSFPNFPNFFWRLPFFFEFFFPQKSFSRLCSPTNFTITRKTATNISLRLFYL